MALYEYRLEHKPAGGRIAQITDRLNALAEEGWEPYLMSGGEELTILLRRPRREPAMAPAAGAAAATVSPGAEES
jgi:hypothetical protein